MKHYLAELFPRIVRYSKKLNNEAVLLDKPWVLLTEAPKERELWIFKKGGKLIVSVNGIAKKGKWDYLSEANSLYIKIGKHERLYNQAFIDDVALLIKVDTQYEIYAFANENKVEKLYQALNHLEQKYLKKSEIKALPGRYRKEEEIDIAAEKYNTSKEGMVISFFLLVLSFLAYFININNSLILFLNVLFSFISLHSVYIFWKIKSKFLALSRSM